MGLLLFIEADTEACFNTFSHQLIILSGRTVSKNDLIRGCESCDLIDPLDELSILYFANCHEFLLIDFS